jgi:HNH endonuclease
MQRQLGRKLRYSGSYLGGHPAKDGLEAGATLLINEDGIQVMVFRKFIKEPWENITGLTAAGFDDFHTRLPADRFTVLAHYDEASLVVVQGTFGEFIFQVRKKSPHDVQKALIPWKSRLASGDRPIPEAPCLTTSSAPPIAARERLRLFRVAELKADGVLSDDLDAGQLLKSSRARPLQSNQERDAAVHAVEADDDGYGRFVRNELDEPVECFRQGITTRRQWMELDVLRRTPEYQRGISLGTQIVAGSEDQIRYALAVLARAEVPSAGWQKFNESVRSEWGEGGFSLVLEKLGKPGGRLPVASDAYVRALLITAFGFHPTETQETLLRIRHMGPQEILANAGDLKLLGTGKEIWFEETGLTVKLTEQRTARGSPAREPIPERVRHEVWRRDEGRCVECGSRERLEFDHIIPLSQGGSNTTRNLELRCESCNRAKAAKI